MPRERPAKISGAVRTFTPPAMAVSHSPDHRDVQAIWMAARDDEQATIFVRACELSGERILTSVDTVTRSTEFEEVVDTTGSESSHTSGNEIGINFLWNY